MCQIKRPFEKNVAFIFYRKLHIYNNLLTVNLKQREY